MKQITAIIQPHMLGRVEHALHELPHFPGFTLLRAKGHGRGRAADHAWHATEGDIDEHDKVVLLIICPDLLASQLVETIQKNAHTGFRETVWSWSRKSPRSCASDPASTAKTPFEKG